MKDETLTVTSQPDPSPVMDEGGKGYASLKHCAGTTSGGIGQPSKSRFHPLQN